MVDKFKFSHVKIEILFIKTILSVHVLKDIIIKQNVLFNKKAAIMLLFYLSEGFTCSFFIIINKLGQHTVDYIFYK